MNIIWSGFCQDGSDCQACCFAAKVVDVEASITNGYPIYYWEDRCEQTDDFSAQVCSGKRKHSQSIGCPCNSDNAQLLNENALDVDSVYNWYENNFQNGCGCQTGGAYAENYSRSCCVNGFYAGNPSIEYSCNGSGNYPIDCNTEECSETYNNGYITGLEEGILLGAQSGDSNGDGVLDILDMVIYINMIVNG